MTISLFFRRISKTDTSPSLLSFLWDDCDFKETAHILGDISERSVRRLIASGELPPPVKVLSAPRLYHSEVKSYLEKLRNKRPSPRR